MLKRICSWILYRILGFTTEVTVEHPEKFIICLAPHTSNWDFIISILYSRAEKLPCNFLMKKEWFFWPLGILFRRLGGIPVYRQKHSSMTDNLAETAKKEKIFRLTITPEGTRKRNADWKKGFYFIALKAGIPILLYALDYEKRKIVCTRNFVPTGDVDKDMEEIKQYYKDFKGKKPELFAI